MNYQQLWQHYDDVKTKHHLTYTDILRQMDVYPSSVYISYLSDKTRIPASKGGTIGGGFRDLLTKYIDKTDWVPSNVSYEDKLNEMMSSGYYITAHISPTCKDCISCDKCNNIPSIDVNINVSEVKDDWSEEQLQGMFTIDGVVPKINKITKSMYL